MKTTALVTICVLFLGSVALADWDRSQPSKYFQLPDKTPLGMDVKAGFDMSSVGGEPVRKILADDFPCHQRGLITDIHIWGSWKNDDLPVHGGQAHPGNASFYIGLWTDVPAIPGQMHSHPGELLREYYFNMGEYVVRPAFQGPEDWFDPNTEQWINDNHQNAYQYNFIIDEADAYMQAGETAAGEPTVYWLSVDVDVWDDNQEAEFGWKTSEEHWNDDATWMDATWIPDGTGGGHWDWTGAWNELLYPDGHELQGESIDLAFVITPEPTTMSLLAIGGLLVLKRRRRK